MAPITPFLLLSITLSVLSPLAALQTTSNITLGSSLSIVGNSTYWVSPSGRFAFGFLSQSNNSFAICIWYHQLSQKTVTWTAKRNDPLLPSSATLEFTKDGMLLRQPDDGGQGEFLVEPNYYAFSASMLDSGNFVIYDEDYSIIWQSFDYPTDTLLPRQLLQNGKRLVSSTSESDFSEGSFELVMQSDGNLVMYPLDVASERYAYWATETNSPGEDMTLSLDENGVLYLSHQETDDIEKNLTWATSTPSQKIMYRVTLDADGILRLYSLDLDQKNGNWSINWSNIADRCHPTGFCGINGYCDYMGDDQEAVCTCVPGYEYISQDNTNLGCTRNFEAETCAVTKEVDHVEYSMEEISRVGWEDHAYLVLPSPTKDDCKQKCMQDCKCGAALFHNQECRKQKLPLKFGKINYTAPITLVKVGTRSLPAIVSTRSKHELQNIILAAGVSCLAFAFLVFAMSLLVISRIRWPTNNRQSNELNGGLVEDLTLRSFTYEELQRATDGFIHELGRGTFGRVFKGTLSNREKEVAVKRLERVVADAEVEFWNEMRAIGKTHHRNVVRLLGYCHDRTNRLLVYEYMSNGSLANFLFKSKTKPSWEERVGIALSIARGIHYLHEECESQIIHCDINPNNILMDKHHCPKISDFGLAKLIVQGQSRTLTELRGTRGYVAPEWHKSQPISVKVDVYSYGIVFLEIICYRRSVSTDVPEEEGVLAEWVRTCFEANELSKLVGEDEVDSETLHRMVSIGIWCIQEEPSLRPSMKKVILMLEGTAEIPAHPTVASFGSSYNSTLIQE